MSSINGNSEIHILLKKLVITECKISKFRHGLARLYMLYTIYIHFFFVILCWKTHAILLWIYFMSSAQVEKTLWEHNQFQISCTGLSCLRLNVHERLATGTFNKCYSVEVRITRMTFGCNPLGPLGDRSSVKPEIIMLIKCHNMQMPPGSVATSNGV